MSGAQVDREQMTTLDKVAVLIACMGVPAMIGDIVKYVKSRRRQL